MAVSARRRHLRGPGDWDLRKDDEEWAASYQRDTGDLTTQQMTG